MYEGGDACRVRGMRGIGESGFAPGASVPVARGDLLGFARPQPVRVDHRNLPVFVYGIARKDIVWMLEKRLLLQHPIGIRQRPTLPGRLQPSTISAWRLNCCVRYGNRWDPPAIATGNRMTFSGDALVLGLGLSVDRLRFSSASNVRILKTAQEK